MMEQLSVERSMWIAAPRERVWQAVTDPEQIAQWLLPPALGAQLKRDGKGTLLVCLGPMEIPFANVEVDQALWSVRTQSLPERLLTTAYRLEEENDGTRITVTMTGFERLPADTRQDHLEPAGTSWEKALANLNAFIAGAALPFPEGYIAALSGYRRQTKQLFAVERSIWIAAPRERVWRAITNPAQMEQWFSPGTTWQMSALEVGGKLFTLDPETGAELYTQLIQQVDPPQRFAIQTIPEPSGGYQMTTYTLREEEQGTRLTVIHSGYEAMPEEARGNAMEQNAFGFGMMLENVKAYIEGSELPYPQGF
ncbi:MAG TPA: SRPBCC family protein [Roseiflexaceae bacterium]|jgi:uncharacterized protein YndB with AHSA1/START domain|nr:SRPBCC family protein [Roseiflexaceae bacterium]